MTRSTPGLALALAPAFAPGLAALLLAGCASRPGQPPAETQATLDARRQSEFNHSQDRWHGAKVQELVAKLGPPTSKARQPDGRQVYVYAKTAKVTGPVGPISFSCVVRYVIDDRMERVASHSIEGC